MPHKTGDRLIPNEELISHLRNRPNFNALNVYIEAEYIELRACIEEEWVVSPDSGGYTGNIPDHIIQEMQPHPST